MTKKPSQPMPVLALPNFPKASSTLCSTSQTWHTHAASTRGSGSSRERKLDLSRLSRSSCWPKKWPTANKPACSAAPARLTFPSSRPLMSSISLCSRLAAIAARFLSGTGLRH